MASIKSNIFWNVVRVTSNLCFPLITFPYASRILGPDSIGLLNYALAIAAYFTLFASFGFPIYGIREVAVAKVNIADLEKVTNSIFSANLLFSMLVCLLYLIFCIYTEKENLPLFLITGLSIILSSISFEWFYQGIEDFKYLTIRGLIIKSISVVCLFIFVRTEKDLLYYALINIGATCGNNILNLHRLKKYISLKFCKFGIRKHISGASIFFAGTIATSLYTYLNDILVGSLDTMSSVGYFSTGNKLIHILLSIITVISMSSMPKLSSLVQSKDEAKNIDLLSKCINLILYIALPITVGLFILSDQITLIFAGEKFGPTSTVLKILSFTILAISISTIFGNQILIPNRMEKYGNYAVIIGGVFNIMIAILLIPKFSYIGSSISLLCTEIIVALIHIYYGRNYIKLSLTQIIPYKAIVSCIIMSIVLLWCIKINNTPAYAIIWVILAILVYFGSLILLRDSFLRNQLQMLKIKIHK